MKISIVNFFSYGKRRIDAFILKNKNFEIECCIINMNNIYLNKFLEKY
jgi:hypothetical protein